MGNNIKINDEVYGTSIASEISYNGDASGLEATNTQDAIDELAYSIKSGESDIMAREVLASTLTQLGVPTSSDSSFVTINENIMILAEQKYDEGNADAVAACMIGNAMVGDVLSGKTFTNKNDAGLTGTMVNQGAKSTSLNAGGSYTIPAGYHNGSGKITANSLASQTSATAAAANITKGYTAWVNGVKITGTRPVPVTSQTGTFSFAVNDGDSKVYNITFPKAFDSTSYTITYSVTGGYYAQCTTMTTQTKQKTGCTVKVSIRDAAGNGATGTITWRAEL